MNTPGVCAGGREVICCVLLKTGGLDAAQISCAAYEKGIFFGRYAVSSCVRTQADGS